ncbi:MAG: enoyl-CoA hydratase/isomerase family protein [Planctomycetota bacterium]|jgi:enoyl-CoA hydratase/carnithine racemase
MNSQLRSERRGDGIATLWLGNPHRREVVIDAWLLDQLHLLFDELEGQTPLAGFILMSENRRDFATGPDLSEIDEMPDEQLLAYLTEGAEVFARIAALPCPSVAAINGAALGGGLEIALHCDGLICAKPAVDAEPYRIGLPQTGMGLCPGWGGTQMLPARIDPATAITMAATGATTTVADVPHGLIDRVVDNEVDLYEAAVHWIETHAQRDAGHRPRCIDESNRQTVASGLNAVRSRLPNTAAAHAVVEAVEIGIAEGWAAALAAERRLLVSLRHTETARTRLQACLARNA